MKVGIRHSYGEPPTREHADLIRKLAIVLHAIGYDLMLGRERTDAEVAAIPRRNIEELMARQGVLRVPQSDVYVLADKPDIEVELVDD